MQCAAFALILSASPESAKRLELAPPRFGEAIAAVGDVTGDGVTDLAVSITEGVVLYSGRTGAIVWRTAGKATGFAPMRDIDGDGVGDVLVGGHVSRLLSGKDGAVLKRFDVASAGDVDVLGDLDGDGHEEFLVATTRGARVLSTRDDARVIALSTSDDQSQAVRWTRADESGIALAAEQMPAFHWMRAVDDLNGDGRIDIGWVDGTREKNGEMSRLRIRAVSASTRAELPSITLLDPCPATEGFRVAPAGDVNQDGRADVLVAFAGSCARTYSGLDGTLLVTFVDPCPGGYLEGFADTAVALGDLDGDQVSDVVFGCKEYIDSGDEYYAAVCSGRTGNLLHIFRHEHRPGHYHFVAAPGDVDDDGRPDIAVLVPECGSLTVYSGKDFKWIRTLHPPCE